MAVHRRPAAAALLDLPLPKDDTEESVVGADWHQESMLQAYGPLKDYAAGLAADGAAPWYVSCEVTILVMLPGTTHLWRPKPDLFVVRGVSPEGRTSYDTRQEGSPFPQFVLEVASASTWRKDIDNKQQWYGRVGVREYLVFDPTQAHLKVAMQGWHRSEEGWVPWPARRQGDGAPAWDSQILGLAVRPEGRLVRFDHPLTGPLPLRSELQAWLAQERQALAEERQMLAEERRRRAALEDELRRLRGDLPAGR